jgi:hypothetical protein
MATLLLPTIALADSSDNLPTKQPFTGLYAQASAGIQTISLGSTVNVNPQIFVNTSVTKDYSKTGPSGELAAGYRFALKKHILMGVGVLGEITRYKETQSFDFAILPAFGSGTYTVTSTLSHSYSVTPYLELALVGSNNLASVFAGPKIIQMTRETNALVNGDNLQNPVISTNTQASLVVGSTLEHLITPSLGVFIKGMYTQLPKLPQSTQDSLQGDVSTITASHGHVYTAQMGLELAFG